MEISALVRIIDELDYYQILHLEQGATQSQVKRAYFVTARVFHPDANRHLGEPLRGECSHISKRVTEAYCILRDPRRRAAYDGQCREEGGSPRIQLAEARASHAKKDSEERQGKTPQGRQFYQKARTAIQRGDTAEAVNHLQMALTFEAGNSYFKELLSELKQKA
jgi:DnaJ-class molecular chaperone